MNNPYAGLSYAELCGRRKDYAKLLHAAQAARKAAERHMTLIREAMETAEEKPHTFEASDHAVVRYLERIEGLDVGAIRDVISLNCAGGTPIAGENIRSADGHIYCVNNEGYVTTVLPEGAVLEELHRDIVRPADNGKRKRIRREKREFLKDRYTEREPGSAERRLRPKARVAFATRGPKASPNPSQSPIHSELE